MSVHQDSIDKVFSMVTYYFRQYIDRCSKHYLDIACHYCKELLVKPYLPEAVLDKARYLCGACCLLVGHEADDSSKKLYYGEAASHFIQLKELTLFTARFDEVPIACEVFDDFFTWSRNRERC